MVYVGWESPQVAGIGLSLGGMAIFGTWSLFDHHLHTGIPGMHVCVCVCICRKFSHYIGCISGMCAEGLCNCRWVYVPICVCVYVYAYAKRE